MAKIRTWHGVDTSNNVSLFEYDFLIRWNSKRKMYDVIYQQYIGKDVAIYFYDSWDADNWREMLQEGDCYDVHELADMCGMDAETYLTDTTDANLLNDILAYYGAYEIGLGDYCTPHTESVVRARLNKALDR